MNRFAKSMVLALAGVACAGAAHAGAVVPDEAQWEKVSTAGKAFAEGVVAARDGSIYLVDLLPPGTLFRYDPRTKETTTVAAPDGLANGLYVDVKSGDLIMGLGTPPALARRNLKTGEVTTLVDRYQGKRLIGPNDITEDAQGRIYFTDARFNQKEEPELPNAVYRLDPDGKLTQLTTEINRPNGIEISPDGKHLYVADTVADRLQPNPHNPPKDRFGFKYGGVIVYDLAADGSISNGRAFYAAEVALPDGMTMDTDGNLYVASHDKPTHNRQIVVIDPSGKIIQNLPVPESLTVQLGFGRGEDSGTLYLAGGDPWGLYRIKTNRKGFYRD